MTIEETTTPENLAESVQRFPLRHYEITFASGRRQTLYATRVTMPKDDFTGRGPNMVEFRAPLDPESHLGRAGQLVLAAQLGTVIVQIRDLDADIADVWTATVTVKRSFWQRFLDAFTFTNTAKRGES